MELAEDQQAVRDQLKEQGLVAFVADDAVLPRESGISSRPMKAGGYTHKGCSKRKGHS